jgi:hypothetical protein
MAKKIIKKITPLQKKEKIKSDLKKVGFKMPHGYEVSKRKKK